jgi:hypothetical protein
MEKLWENMSELTLFKGLILINLRTENATEEYSTNRFLKITII